MTCSHLLLILLTALLFAMPSSAQQPLPPKVRVSVVSMLWDEKQRTVERVLQFIEEAGRDGADIVCFPQDCVITDGEPIPGPIAQRIAAKAKEWGLYVIANLRERDGGKLYQTSFLIDRQGNVVGKYRQSHRMPDEKFDLGDELPVFKTDFGTIALKSGTDHYFPEIDRVYSFTGADIIFWSTEPFPVEDEYPIDVAFRGRAMENSIYMACARYAGTQNGYITNNYDGRIFGCPIGRSYIVDPEGHTIADTGYTGGGVATASIYKTKLNAAGKGVPEFNRKGIFKLIGERIPNTQYATRNTRRPVRVSIVEAHLGIDELLKRLDEAGQMGSDIVCCYEFVWLNSYDEKQREQGRQNLARVAEKAKQWKMYIVIAGVLDNIERNSGVLFDREGKEVGRYHKIYKTHDQQIVGTDVPVFETDFGRIGIRICADEWSPEIDRCYALQGADIIFTPTQSWGPYAAYRELREMSRCVDNVSYLVSATHTQSESDHRSFICDPSGVIVARGDYYKNGIVTAVIDLDNKPFRYVREYTDVQVGGYLPEYQSGKMPVKKRDLREAVFAMRRPELYRIISHPTETSVASK